VTAVISGLLLSGALAAAAVASALYPGAGGVFIAFNACFLAITVLAIPRPRAYVYTFLAAFLVLGFWLKVVYQCLSPGFVEPVGDFRYTPHEWDRGLVIALCGVLGVIVARLIHLWLARDARPEATGTPPGWYVRWSRPVWIATIVLIVAVNAANLYFAFYQIGVRPKTLLPLRGHVLLAWLVNIGFALWVAALIWWDYLRRPVLGRNLLLPAGEALVSATSAFSRMIFLVHTVPYVLAIFERKPEFKRRTLYRLGATVLFLFVLSVVAVFWLRVYQYYGYAADLPGNEPLAQHVERTMYKQVPLLLVHRWVGLEGVLAVGATEQSPGRLAVALTESPKGGGDTLFQRVAKTRYLAERPDEFVFLANAGPVAVLWFSGSIAVVFLGMGLITLVMLATEEAARRWTGNPFLLAVAGAALANVVSQTTFFYLTLVFLLQLWLALALLGGLQRLRLRNT
jgi:hypothetical protein